MKFVPTVHPRVGGEHFPTTRAIWSAYRFIPAWAGNTAKAKPLMLTVTVHPRVGGEHRLVGSVVSNNGGSSPRGRGTLSVACSGVFIVRFIPAWAGNTLRLPVESLVQSVHPRVGGEHFSSDINQAIFSGSSPRGRGTQSTGNKQLIGPRFIPAWAGNTWSTIEAAMIRTVHPRVGGEHPTTYTQRFGRFGSSPRGRGTRIFADLIRESGRFIPAWAGNTGRAVELRLLFSVHPRVGGEHFLGAAQIQTVDGSSPRGRGTRFNRIGRCRGRRFIPAWAGNTRRRPVVLIAVAVHPRVGGEHPSIVQQYLRYSGSSPRGRGTPSRLPGLSKRQRFIPAWAGNTWEYSTDAERVQVHPRVGGEHSNPVIVNVQPTGSSPRGRGTLAVTPGHRRDHRFIPAWAGNTPLAVARAVGGPVHPRVGGEHGELFTRLSVRSGSSPRGRGTPRDQWRESRDIRFIPAWAGNTHSERSDISRQPVHPRVGGEHYNGTMPQGGMNGSSPRGRGTLMLAMNM